MVKHQPRNLRGNELLTSEKGPANDESGAFSSRDMVGILTFGEGGGNNPHGSLK